MYIYGYLNRIQSSRRRAVLVCAVRDIGLRHTPFADAAAGAIRLRLFKIGVALDSVQSATGRLQNMK
jgi:hypothetical protein